MLGWWAIRRPRPGLMGRGQPWCWSSQIDGCVNRVARKRPKSSSSGERSTHDPALWGGVLFVLYVADSSKFMNIQSPLSEKEVNLLDDLFRARIDEDADTEGKDEGILCVFRIGRFSHGDCERSVYSSPSRWLPALWGDFGPSGVASMILRQSSP